jgi:hypothetical protein
MRLAASFRRLDCWKKGLIVAAGLVVTAGGGITVLYLYTQSLSNSNDYVHRWFDDKSSRPALSTVQREPCPGAPFLLPSDGLIGLLWRDTAAPYSILRRHSGIDIFGAGEPGTVPVVAAIRWL